MDILVPPNMEEISTVQQCTHERGQDGITEQSVHISVSPIEEQITHVLVLQIQEKSC